MIYLLIGDVVKSSDNTFQAFKALNEVEQAVNNHFQKKCLYPLTITLGDEFQMLVEEKETVEKVVAVHKSMMEKKGFAMRYVAIPFPHPHSLIPMVQKHLPHFNPLATPELTMARQAMEELKINNIELKILKEPTEKQRQKNKGLGLDYKCSKSIMKMLPKSA